MGIDNFSHPGDQFIRVEISRQKLILNTDGITREYDVSTSRYGIGNIPNSFKTPLGKHEIIRKIGAGVPLGGIFVKGDFTGKTCFDISDSSEDLITSRIFILKGLEPGTNDNSRRRGIWVHGTQQEDLIGTAASHGCIRLRNEDMIDLFDRVKVGTIIEIVV